MKMKFSLLIVAASLMVGCGEEAKLIEEVKNSPLNDQFTYAQAFEKNYCQSHEWSVEKDENNRDTVKYVCKYTIPHSILNSLVVRTYVKNELMEVYFSLPHYQKFKDEQSKFDTYREKYRYIDLEEVKQAEKELKDYYGIANQDEYIKASIALSRLENEDLQTFQREITPNYAAKFLSKYPQEFNVTKTMYVTVLPNGKTQWVVPTFYVHELNREFFTESNILFIAEITNGMQTQEYKNQMDVDLLKKTLVISREDEEQYAAYIQNHCEGDPCLVLPTVDFYFGETTEEGDDWDN